MTPPPFDTWSSRSVLAASSVAPQPGTALIVFDPTPARWEHALERVVVAGTRPRTARGLAIAIALAVGANLAGALWLAIPLFGVGVAHYVVAAAYETRRIAAEERARGPLARPLVAEVRMFEIESAELRLAFHDVLERHEEIRRELLAAQRLQPCFRPLLERCGALVQRAGRLARLANPLERYLRDHSTTEITKGVDEATRRSTAIGDPLARAAHAREAHARGHQLGTVLEIEAIRERIRAQVGIVNATLAAVGAAIVKAQVIDQAEAELAADLAAGDATVAALAEEIEALEALLDDSAQALAA